MEFHDNQAHAHTEDTRPLSWKGLGTTLPVCCVCVSVI